ncbi:hypothetical protein QCA50_021070 [Cerrena zonata]|uniref:Uncharacterized protein n=1 Tax=Cerrena zonata TaxID=2478898 RepID=A0AAW0FEQ1_9APHY
MEPPSTIDECYSCPLLSYYPAPDEAVLGDYHTGFMKMVPGLGWKAPLLFGGASTMPQASPVYSIIKSHVLILRLARQRYTDREAVSSDDPRTPGRVAHAAYFKLMHEAGTNMLEHVLKWKEIWNQWEAADFAGVRRQEKNRAYLLFDASLVTAEAYSEFLFKQEDKWNPKYSGLASVLADLTELATRLVSTKDDLLDLRDQCKAHVLAHN